LKNIARAVALAMVVPSLCAPLSAQTATKAPGANSARRGEIRGIIIGAASKQPIAIATVEVMKAGTPSVVVRAAAGTDGAFRAQGVAVGRYSLRLRALGYLPLEIPLVVVTSSALNVDLGKLYLKITPLELTQLVVSGARKAIDLAPDRNTYAVGDMAATAGGSALDVLRNVPSIGVDIDNTVSLRGNSGVVVQINGRPSPMKAAQLGDFLSQLPADMVEKVEVIPNPSARDDPTGVAGIINLVLKQKTDAGSSGAANATGATTGQAGAGGNYGYQHGAFNFYGSYGFQRNTRPETQSIFRQNTYLTPMTYLTESVKRTETQLGHTFTGSAGYQFDKRNELSLETVFNTRTESQSSGILYNDLSATLIPTDLSDRNTLNSNDRTNVDVTVGYKHAYAAKGHKFSSEFNFNQQREGGPTNVNAHSLLPNGFPLATTALEHQSGLEKPSETSLKVDYVQPFLGLARLETGYKGSLQLFNTTMDTHVFDASQDAYVADSSRISDFTYRQLVNAAYGMLSAQVGNVQLQGGLRAERAATRFHLNTTQSTFTNDYNSLFPSALVAYNIDDAHQVKMSYSTRIRRPDDTDVLDPSLHYADPLNVSRGNPYLKPEYIRALELGLQRTAERMTLQVTPFWRHTINAVRQLRTIDSVGVATRTYANVSTSDSYGTDATVALNGGKLSGFAATSLYRQVSNAANIATGLSVKTFGWSAQTNASYRFSRTFDVQAIISYQAAVDVEQGHNAARTRVSMAARQKIFNDRMSATLRIIDPFSTSRETSTTTDPRFYQQTSRLRHIRGFSLTLSRNFGSAPKKAKDDPIDQSSGAS
jgi:hypothetical protein